uniref:Choline/ethanolaminephosphotransferase 1-like n=1 Tax=Tanacetum cinerariifolium TaxID=118510 RepID=A0A6L2J5E4_TANCI|nr:choline/ethanolaminephosphotransferase 1-like [Tanacetum cinerariifolium]
MEHTIIPSTKGKSRKGVEGELNFLRIAIQLLKPKRELHNYKYSGVDHSYVSKYVLQPFWANLLHSSLFGCRLIW